MFNLSLYLNIFLHHISFVKFSMSLLFPSCFHRLAGGYYQSYLYNQCPGSTILTVESNPTVVAAARDFFGFEGGMGRLGRCGMHESGEGSMVLWILMPHFLSMIKWSFQFPILNPTFTSNDIDVMHNYIRPCIPMIYQIIFSLSNIHRLLLLHMCR